MERRDGRELLKRQNHNLSDFALFLSVMKNKEAYQCTLSIIPDEQDLELTEVKVEEVVLNESGKRARFYQGLMDSPVLKSGRQTKYKELPSTIIILLPRRIYLAGIAPSIPLQSSVRKSPDFIWGTGHKRFF